MLRSRASRHLVSQIDWSCLSFSSCCSRTACLWSNDIFWCFNLVLFFRIVSSRSRISAFWSSNCLLLSTDSLMLLSASANFVLAMTSLSLISLSYLDNASTSTANLARWEFASSASECAFLPLSSSLSISWLAISALSSSCMIDLIRSTTRFIFSSVGSDSGVRDMFYIVSGVSYLIQALQGLGEREWS